MGDLINKIKDLASAATGPTLEIVSETLLDGAAGTVVPGVGNIILSYKQNRMERRVESVLQELVSKQEEFNSALSKLQDQVDIQNVKGKYFEMLMDYAIDEPQDEKVQYLVNGYINVAQTPHPQEDVVRIFYDTLEQINLLDIRVLRLYSFSTEDDVYKIMEDYQIDTFQYNMVREKLVRLGLIYSKNELQRDENVDAIVAYLENLSKGKQQKLKAKKISRSQSYRLSSYGSRFIKFIESEYNIDEEITVEQEDDEFL